MKINNKTKALKFKRLFFLVSVFIALIALVFFLFVDDWIYAIASVITFSLWFLYFHVADYQFIEFSDENNKVILRYYKAVRLGKTAFHSIEFPQQMLKEVFFENSIFGKLSDVTLVVQTKRGTADYPSVSLSAVPEIDRMRIEKALNKILEK